MLCFFIRNQDYLLLSLVELSDLINKNTKYPVKFEFHINNDIKNITMSHVVLKFTKNA